LCEQACVEHVTLDYLQLSIERGSFFTRFHSTS
jgi:hypothetical protein